MTAVDKSCVINDVFVGSFLIPFNTSKKVKMVICPMCRKEIKNETSGRFIGCNYKLFPNSICHPDCVEKAGGLQATAEKLKSMNDRFKQLKAELRNEYGTIGWFLERKETEEYTP